LPAPVSDCSAFRWTRRRWLSAVLSGGCGFWLRRAAIAADAVEEEEAQVQERARKVGLGPFRSTVTEHHLGIGDAPDAYRNGALKLAATLAKAYLQAFQEKGFAVAYPPRRLTVVTLKDRISYGAFLGEDPGDVVGGHYDLDTNRLVIFDFRPGGETARQANLERINTFTLIHEATHQLTYSTGLLDPRADVPVAISEGLAMYAELWRPDGRSVLGMINRPRLKVLVDRANQNANQEEVWFPLERLLTDDALFQDPAAQQLAYAEAWVLVHYLIKTPAFAPKLPAYLDALRSRRDSTERLTDARGHLGDLDRLNGALRKHAKRLIQGG
jgi:hypothetical protein